MASITDVVTALQNGVNALNTMAENLALAFPTTTATSTSAPAVGTITYTSSQARGFLVVQTSSGSTAYVPFF